MIITGIMLSPHPILSPDFPPSPIATRYIFKGKDIGEMPEAGEDFKLSGGNEKFTVGCKGCDMFFLSKKEYTTIKTANAVKDNRINFFIKT